MSALMLFHVVTGTVAVLAGAAALFARKGGRVHRAAGNLFFVTMLCMATAGATIAFRQPTMITVLAGVFTVYLVATAWAAVRRPAGTVGAFDYLALAVALTISAGGLVFGMQALDSAEGLKDGFSHEPYFFFAGLALIAAGLDVNQLVRRGLAGAHRIARHLWRMCLALYIAAGSLFTGPGAQAFPESLRGTAVLSVPENLVALLMLFYLARVLLGRRFKGTRP